MLVSLSSQNGCRDRDEICRIDINCNSFHPSNLTGTGNYVAKSRHLLSFKPLKIFQWNSEEQFKICKPTFDNFYLTNPTWTGIMRTKWRAKASKIKLFIHKTWNAINVLEFWLNLFLKVEPKNSKLLTSSKVDWHYIMCKNIKYSMI